MWLPSGEWRWLAYYRASSAPPRLRVNPPSSRLRVFA
jgi:hypothetical protein